MKYFSMFSGVGGFELGIQQAYEDNSKCEYIGKESKQEDSKTRRVWAIVQQDKMFRTPIGSAPLCIGYSEIDKYAIQIFEKHFNIKNYGDATKIDTRQLPDFDLLVGGFPCQAFSIAGKRKGFDDTRGTLFFEVARILRDKRPRYFVLENVKGLLSHDNGKTFQTILGVLTDLGYFVEWQVLNSKNFGVPQNRERVFFIGHLGGECKPKVFPVRKCNERIDEPNVETTQAQISGTIDSRTGSYPKWGQYVQMKHRRQSDEFRFYEKTAETVSSSYGTGDGNTPMIVPVLTPDRPNKRQNGRRFKNNGEPSFTLTGQDIHGVAINYPALTTELAHSTGRDFKRNGAKKIFEASMQIRRLTPTECERLQGFPDGWTEGISDTQRYKCLGNAVTVNVIREIFKQLTHNKKI